MLRLQRCATRRHWYLQSAHRKRIRQGGNGGGADCPAGPRQKSCRTRLHRQGRGRRVRRRRRSQIQGKSRFADCSLLIEEYVELGIIWFNHQTYLASLIVVSYGLPICSRKKNDSVRFLSL